MTGRGRRQEVLAAARDAFAERGYEATATRDIAARLGILGGSLYHYISSKEDLLHELLVAVQAPGADALARAAAEGGTGAERLAQVVRAHVAMIARDPAGIALTFTESGCLSPPRREEIIAGLRAYRRGVARIVAEGQADGSLRSDLDPRLASLVALGAVNWLHRWYRPDGRLGVDALGDMLAATILQGLAADDATGAPQHVPSPPAATPVPPAALPAGGERRTGLLRAAGELFAEQGYDATTIKQVAERAGVQKATVYHYVAGKRELLFELMCDVQEPGLGLLGEAEASGADGAGTLRVVIHRHTEHLVADRHRTALFLHQVRSLDTEQQRVIRARERAYTAGVVALVARGVRDGSLGAEVDPPLAGRAVLGAANWVHEWYRPDGIWSPQTVGSAISAVLVDGMGAGAVRSTAAAPVV